MARNIFYHLLLVRKLFLFLSDVFLNSVTSINSIRDESDCLQEVEAKASVYTSHQYSVSSASVLSLFQIEFKVLVLI